MAAFALSAIQVLPSSEWSRRSERAAYRSPRSIYEVPSYLARDKFEGDRSSIARGLFGEPESGMHHGHIYEFSVGPWRLPEFVWPNFSGQMFPAHRRWASVIPAEGRVWTPSLYLGLVPLLLGLSVWRVRGGPVAVRWLSWASLLATLASFGGYGVGWLLHEFRCGVLGAQAEDVILGWPVGGLYWLLVVTLPGYAYFRYPAKLMVIAALGLSQLAAFGLDRLREREPETLRRWTLGFVIVQRGRVPDQFGDQPRVERVDSACAARYAVRPLRCHRSADRPARVAAARRSAGRPRVVAVGRSGPPIAALAGSRLVAPDGGRHQHVQRLDGPHGAAQRLAGNLPRGGEHCGARVARRRRAALIASSAARAAIGIRSSGRCARRRIATARASAGTAKRCTRSTTWKTAWRSSKRTAVRPRTITWRSWAPHAVTAGGVRTVSVNRARW